MEEKKSKISYFSANITPIISVSLVLLLLGIVAMLGIAANSLTDYVKENIGFDVVMKNDASQQEIDALKQMWTKAPYVASVKYISKEDALQSWEKETGENLMEVIGVNPLSSEFEVRVKPQYVSVDSLNRIEYALSQNKSIDSVKMHKDVVEKINSNVNSVVLVLGAVLVLLVIISFVLINNTVRLAVYSRRFIIYTMKLVGATPGFIRRPFVLTNVVNGLIASLVAMAMLCGLMYYVVEVNYDYANLIEVKHIVVVCAGLMVVGVLMCALAALLAANRFISLNYDELYTK
ncbi:MAG: permease-like cell division protein FtsX [Muribaculaceae bacterium]|nr:permease-like cell division protein FtsX [Muribaculaceae bacterium]